MKKKQLTKTVALHYFKLIFRSILFLAAVGAYLYNRIHQTGRPFSGYEHNPILLDTIWIVFMVEMICRFFPVKIESMGSQKQFARNYVPVEGAEERPTVLPGMVTFGVAAAWIALNAVIGVLYYARIIDKGILLLIALAYSVCDVICILFFCPFQTWFMKNKCCGTCRIYNWDYAMMFTPLIYIPNVYAWTLLGTALALLVKWEVILHRHPERFSEKTNQSLRCAMCTEKLCHQKRQLQGFLKKGKFNLAGNPLAEVLKREKERETPQRPAAHSGEAD